MDDSPAWMRQPQTAPSADDTPKWMKQPATPQAAPQTDAPRWMREQQPKIAMKAPLAVQAPGPQDPSIIARTKPEPTLSQSADTLQKGVNFLLDKVPPKIMSAIAEKGGNIVESLLTPTGPLDPVNLIPNREALARDLKTYLFEGGNVATMKLGEAPEAAKGVQPAKPEVRAAGEEAVARAVAEPLKATGTDGPAVAAPEAKPAYPVDASRVSAIDEKTRAGQWRVQLPDGNTVRVNGTQTGGDLKINTVDLIDKDENVLPPNKAGTSVIRQVLRSIAAATPDLETVGGERVSGARQAANAAERGASVRAPQSADLGAAGTPKAVLDHFNAVPPTPSKDYIRSTDDSFFRLRGSATADRQQVNEFLKSLPPEMRDPAIQQKLYEFGEPGTNVKLEPKEQALFNKYIRPWKEEESELWKEAQKINGESKVGLKDLDPEYMHRMVKGKTNELDRWSGEGSSAAPQSGYRSLKAASQKERKYFALIGEDGTRKLLHVTPEGTFIIEKGKSTPLPRYEGAATDIGDKLTSGGKKWEVGQANTREIEANTDTRYYKNAAAATIKNTLQLRAVVRAQYELERLKSTPEFAKYARPVSAERPEGWRSPNMPMFSRFWVEPKLADVIDDFWGKRGQDGVLGALAKINRFAVTSLFYSPLPHAMNAAAHWVTARGWSNVTPVGYLSLVVDGAKAIREVVTQGKEYQRMLREGSGLIYGSVANEEFYRVMLKSLGESVQREPFKWDPIARALGVGPSDIVRMLYGASSRALWAASDAMMLQHVFELERRGISTREAIRRAEKHLPNYRIPPQVVGSRVMAQVLKDPNLTEFSRYHYGQLASIGHMAKDLAVGTPAEKFEAVGSILATGALMLWVWPMINEQIQKLTGDSTLELGPKGSTTIPSAVRDWWQGKKELSQVIQGSVTLSPVIRMGIEEIFNRDMFTGKNIREPYDEQQHKFGRTAAQSAEHIAGSTITPYGTINRGTIGRHPVGAGEELMKQGLGLRKVPKVYKGRNFQGTPAQQAAFRRAHPRGSIEEFEKWLENKAQ